jgi:UDP-N-acetylmuramate dehydrogenase
LRRIWFPLLKIRGPVIKTHVDYLIRRLTSFYQSGVVSDLMIIEQPSDVMQLPLNHVPIGAGSNSLISPEISVPLIKVAPNYCDIQVHDDHSITCSAGLPLSVFLKKMTEHSLSGLEFATGVPASLGGMVYMNFECWGMAMGDYVLAVQLYDSKYGVRWVSRSDYDAGYRWTSFHEQSVILLAVRVALTPLSADKIKQTMATYLTRRKEKQPLLNRTFGSVFKNPPHQKVGMLIDQLALKGQSIGDAQVSLMHANFFENTQDATFKDTLALIKLIQNKVHEMYNIKLECEVQIID